MTFPSPSGLFVQTFLTGLNGGIVLDLDLTTHKVALFLDAIVAPDLTTNTGYAVAPWNANEVANGNGYTTGGYTLANTTWAHTAGGVIMWDNTVDPTWAAATFTARGGLYYANALAGKNSIVAQNFGADITATGGAFTITLAAGGIFSIDFVP